MDTKIIAMYLPQYHSIPENDEFWGKGFTDWVSVKKAKSLYEGHIQPKEPANGYYYDLSTVDDVRWQAELAKKYGVYGFGIYHYWFNNEKNLLTKPAEIIKDNKDIDTHYFFAWDNGSWKRSWSNVKGNDWSPIDENKERKGPAILIEYILGKEKDWENHFNYLLPYFQDERYIKVDGKPLFVIYNYSRDIEPMCEYWNQLAINNGFSGVHIIYRYDELNPCPQDSNMYYYQPLCSAGWQKKYTLAKAWAKALKVLNIDYLQTFDYDTIWKAIIRDARNNPGENIIHGGFVSYDDTPRRGMKGKVVKGSNPEKFRKYLTELMNICSQQDKEYVFLTAWNEWSEGAYLEPDNENGFQYLQMIKEVVDKK